MSYRKSACPSWTGFTPRSAVNYVSGSLDIRRGYLNGGAPDYSRGETDTETCGARLRRDWLNAVSGDDWNLTPHASLTHARSQMEAYSEHGGSFPSAFDSASGHSTVARVGLDMITDVTDSFRLTGKVEASYRFEDRTAGTSGRIIGLSRLQPRRAGCRSALAAWWRRRGV